MTAVARLERLDYFAGPYSSYPRRATIGARVRFTRVVSGQYRLRAVAASQGADERTDVYVPSPTGEYDLHLT